MVNHSGMVDRSNAKGHRCINSVLIDNLTKGQGGAIPPMKGTNLQVLKKIENGTDRVWILQFSGRSSDLESQIAKI